MQRLSQIVGAVVLLSLAVFACITTAMLLEQMLAGHHVIACPEHCPTEATR